MHLEHTLDIAAPPEVVWDLTADIERWPSVTPTITALEKITDGPVAVGTRARIEQPGLRPAVWTVEELTPGRKLVWSTRMLGARFVGGHEVVPNGAGCTNRLTLDVTGPSAPLLALVAGTRLRTALDTEGEGFRRAAQAPAP